MKERTDSHAWWSALRHGGLLIAPAHLRASFPDRLPPISDGIAERLRRDLSRFAADKQNALTALLDTVLRSVLRLGTAEPGSGHWLAGSDVGVDWSRRLVTGEAVRPRRLWQGSHGAVLPVFVAEDSRLGVGRGKRATSRVVEWLRLGDQRLALLSNGQQWRLINAGPDHEAWVESDTELWFEAGSPGGQLDGLRALLSPESLSPPAEGRTSILLAAIAASRRSQAELSAVLGERVRQAVELLIREHGPALARLLEGEQHRDHDARVTPAEIYRAATRVVMRMVVILFAEARELLPRALDRYHDSYGLESLRDALERAGGAAGESGRSERLHHRHGAWPRVLALFRLVHEGSPHPGFTVPRYGGQLFASGSPDADDPLERALHVFESEALARGETMSDAALLRVLALLTRSRVRVRQGRSSRWVEGPVDFADLSSEYIGILYEGLLDYELHRAPADDPVLFLALGDEPALPLSRLEPMDDEAIEELVKKAKEKRKLVAEEHEGADEEESEEDEEPPADGEEGPDAEAAEPDDEETGLDERARRRAHDWARRAVVAGKLVARPRSLKPDVVRAHEERVEAVAAALVARTVMPGEWYLVRFGGTRKGSATFYTRPQLAVPTVHRTLRPLAWEPPITDGKPDEDAPVAARTPRSPYTILELKVCDPACGSGSFPVAALRFLTDALYASLFHHGWLERREEGIVPRKPPEPAPAWLEECLADLLSAGDDAEPRLRTRLKRLVVERCIYGVDLDPLAVELAKLALWVETLDPRLPFTFLDHKVRCGNSLVGAWLDSFRDYPVLAWKRKSGDEDHTRGTHYPKGGWAKALKAQGGRVAADLALWIRSVTTDQERMEGILGPRAAEAAHEEAVRLFERLHALPIHEAEARAKLFEEEFEKGAALEPLREAMDLWCALWFWPAEEAASAPLASQMASPSDTARSIARAVASRSRFFHWELEFPDVFAAGRGGFDAVLGNPPWETQKPNSKEFFSSLDPLYRGYGKQAALERQRELFAARIEDERAWLRYVAHFKALGNWVREAAAPFGDPEEGETKFNLGPGNGDLHARWRGRRAHWSGSADREHPFRHQGSADLNTYKLFLEVGHTLLRQSGRMGFIAPSGLYTDKGTTALRTLFLDRCRWHWLFGFENREKVFDIDSRFKFGPVIVEKGGTTEAVRTAFMRRDLGDWEEGERHAIAYSRAQMSRFSPRTRALLEIRDPRDLEILEKIYANGVLLGDDSPDGWGIQYATEFHMTNDSDKFKPRPWWEDRGYRPDVYGRWLKFDAARVEKESRFLQPGWIPLECGGYVQEDAVEDVALPLYEGRMIGQFDFSEKGWVSGKGRAAVWREIPWEAKRVEPQYLMGNATWRESARADGVTKSRVAFMDVTAATNERTMIASTVSRVPCGNSAPSLTPSLDSRSMAAILNSYCYDWNVRGRCGGLHLNYFVIEETSLPARQPADALTALCSITMQLGMAGVSWAPEWLSSCRSFKRHGLRPWRSRWSLTTHERLRCRCILDALVAELYGLEYEEVLWIIRDCDHPRERARDVDFTRALDPKGFWRVDKDRDPELRHTVLSLVAFHDLKQTIAAHGGDRDLGIEAFCSQNDGDGWMLPETLRLSDYGLGHDDRARHPQPVRERMGERFLPWQLEQSVEESWAECEWHARNILGEAGYDRLQRELNGEMDGHVAVSETEAANYPGVPGGQRRLIEGQPNLFGGELEDLPARRRRRAR